MIVIPRFIRIERDKDDAASEPALTAAMEKHRKCAGLSAPRLIHV